MCQSPQSSQTPLKQGTGTFLSGLLLLTVWATLSPLRGVAQTPNQFPPSPLEITTPDPLLPKPPVDRPLSPLERRQLIQDLDQLNLQAQALRTTGQPLEAFNVWYRELRLRRVLGLTQELDALGRVGSIAWGDSNDVAVRIITKRLETIQQQLQTQQPPDWTLLEKLGTIYQQIRLPGQALAVYEQILTEARSRQDRVAETRILKTIGDLHLSWFDYPKAIARYQELLELAKQNGDRLSQFAYTQQLTYLYDQAGQVQQAVDTRQQLVDLYLLTGDLTQLAELKLAIAQGYESLKQLQNAARNYEESYTFAQSLQQFGTASQALQNLAKLYQSQKLLDSAIEVYRILLLVDSRAYNAYGMMETYDQIGKISLELNNSAQAMDAFKRGLNIAQQLGIRRKYFEQQIEKLNQGVGNGE